MSGENQSGPVGKGGRGDRGTEAPTARPRRRRWLRRLLIVIGALLVLLWLAPYLLSTGPATRLILAIANPRLKGRIQVEDLSLSWLGGLEVHGLTVFDPDGREVLRVKAIRTAHGLWHAIWSWEEFGWVKCEAPQVLLYQERQAEGGGFSLARALSPVKPRRKKRRPLPEVAGQVGLAAGAVRVVLADGRALELPTFGGNFDVRTLNKLTGDLTVALPGGGSLACKLDVRGLAESGKVRFRTASGKVSVRSEGEVDLAPLAEFAGREGLGGRAALDRLEVSFGPDRLVALLDVKLRQLAAPLAGGQVKPVDVGLDGLVAMVDKDVTAKVNLSGPVGRMRTEVALNLSQRPVRPDPAQVLSAVLAGEPVELPEFKASVTGGVDLAALAQAVPALLKIRRDAEVTGGTLRVENVSVTGGANPSAFGKIQVKDLAARRRGRTISFEPITAEFDTAVKPGVGLEVRRAALESEFARLGASGVGKSLGARFSADLARLQRQLEEIFELGEFQLGGQVAGRADLAQAGDDRVNVTVHAEADKLQYKSARGELMVQKAVVDQAGYVSLDGRRPRRVTLTQTKADVDGALSAAGAGWYDLKDRSFQARVELKRADLDYLGRNAKAMGFGQLRRYAGLVRLTATAARLPAETSIEAAGEATVQDLRVDGKPLAETDIKLRWSDVRFDPSAKSFAVASAEVKSNLAGLAAKDVVCRYGRPLAVDGQVDLEADLAGCAAAARPFLTGRKLPDLTGWLTLTGTGRTREGKIHFDGGGQIRQGPGQTGKTFLAFVARGSCDTAGEAVNADVEIKPADLEYLAACGKDLGLEPLSRYSGSVALKATVTRASAFKSAGQLAVQDLRLDGKPAAGGQVKLRWDEVRFEPATRLLAAKAVEMQSEVARMTARQVRYRSADPLALDGRFEMDADLAGCVAAAGPFVKLKEPAALTGRLALAADCRTRGNKLSFEGRGQVQPARPGGQAPLNFAGSGFYDVIGEALDAELRVARADLAYVSAQAEALGLKKLAGYAGIASIEARLARKSPGAPLASRGSGTVQKFRVGDTAVSDEDVTLRWSGAEIQTDRKFFAAELVRLRSDFAALTAREFRCRFGKELSADGQVDLTADLARCLAAARPVAGWKKTPALAGRLGWTGSVRTAGGKVTMTGRGGVDDFQAGSGEKVVREKRVDLQVNAEVDTKADTLVLRPVKLDSALLAVQASGSIKALRTQRLLELKGHYRASWDRLWPVIQELAPEAAGKLALAGVSESDFTATGPAHRPQVRPVFRDVQAGTRLGWGSGSAYGLKLGRAELAPELAEGRLVLPTAAVAADGGTLRLGAIVDFTGKRPTLRIDKLQAAERVPVNVELGQVLLSRFNPIFHNVARLTGKASLLLEGLELPLDESVKTGGAGTGRLQMQDVQLLPTGPLSELLKVGGVDLTRPQQVEVSDLDFVIDGGRVRYSNFIVTFAKVFDLRFDGSVYFDDRLDMTVSVPVRSALLEKFGVKGPLRDYARLLEGARVAIPIRGTRQKPKLDWKRVNYLPLVFRAIQAYAAERAARLAREQPRPPTQPAPQPPTQPATRPAKTPEQEIIDTILDLLRGTL